MLHSTAAVIVFWTCAAVPVGVALAALVWALTRPRTKRAPLRVIEGGNQHDEPRRAA